MKKKLVRGGIIAGALCMTLTVPTFAQLQPDLAEKDIKAAPVSYKINHWSQTYIDNLSKNNIVELLFEGKDLDAAISVEDFQKLIKLVIDEKYDRKLDAMTREAVVHEFARIWSEKTGKDLDKVPTIKMIIYSDTNEIDTRYNHSITVAYMKGIAKGKGNGVFDPKGIVSYGEMAALISNTYKAIEDELKARIEQSGTKLDYAHFSIGDIDSDGIFELAYIERVETEIPSARLKVYSFKDNSCKLEYETEFQLMCYPDSVLIGKVNEKQNAIFVELAVGAHSALTEIVVKDEGEYVRVIKSKDEYDFSQTFKPYPLYSQDINNDGIIEVGVQSEPLEAEGYAMVAMPWINNWYQWDGNGGLKKIMEEYSSYSEGYRFIIPESWSGKFAIDTEADENYELKSVNFIYIGGNKQRAELMTIHHISKEDWIQQKNNFEADDQNYVLIGENDRNMLVVELKQKAEKLSEEDRKEYEEMLLSEANIIERFEAIGDKTKLIDLQPEYPKAE